MLNALVLAALVACAVAEIVLAVRIADARQRGDVAALRRRALLAVAILLAIAARGIVFGDRFERVLMAVVGVAGIAALVQVFRRWPNIR